MSDWSSAVCSSDLVARQQIGKDRFLVWFIFDRGAARCRDVGGRRDRNHLLARGFLQQRRTELGIEEMRDVEGAGFVKLHHLGRDVARLLETDVAAAGGFVRLDGLAGDDAVDDERKSGVEGKSVAVRL